MHRPHNNTDQLIRYMVSRKQQNNSDAHARLTLVVLGTTVCRTKPNISTLQNLKLYTSTQKCNQAITMSPATVLQHVCGTKTKKTIQLLILIAFNSIRCNVTMLIGAHVGLPVYPTKTVHVYVQMLVVSQLVSWSLSSPFSTNMAISETIQMLVNLPQEMRILSSVIFKRTCHETTVIYYQMITV